ncbi:MAG: hemagglutinin repeat-containing protein [Moraxellaceae bacterium]|nr:hemagglutinin repeat-containing protein [Moraxellaceae bacterium]
MALQIGNAQTHAVARPTLPADGTTVIAGADVRQPDTPPPAGALLGAGGRIVTAGALTLDADTVDHRDATLSAAQLAVTANGFDNSGGQVVASGEAANTLQVFGVLDNTGGTVASNADLRLRAGWLDNTDGTLQHAGTGAFTLDATRLYGSGGTLVSNGALAITGGGIGLDAGTTQAQRIAIAANTVSNRGGSLIAFGADALSLTARDAFDNSAGTLATNGALAVRAGTLVNADGAISASGTAASTVNVEGTLDNTRGTLATAGALDVKAATLINRDTRGNDGEPAATGLQATALNVEATRVDNSNGQIGASGSVRLKAGSLSNTDGAITAGNALVIDATQLQGQGGTLGANGALTLTGTTLDLRDGTTFAQAIAIDSDRLTTAGGTLTAAGTEALRITARDTLDNTGGTVQGNGALHVAAGTLINRDTRAADGAPAKGLLSAGAMTLDSRRIDNTAGLLATGAAATVTTTDLINQNGAVQAGQGLAITASGLLDNRSGLIAGTDDTTLTAATLDNREGAIQHAGNGALAISATSLNGTGGTIASNGALRLTGTTTNLREATTFAQSIAIDTTDLTTAAGTLTAAGTGALSLTARGTLDNTAGTIQTNGALNLQAGAVTNRDGTVTAAGSGATQLRIVNAFDNSGGTLATAGATTVHAGAITNAAGTIQSGSDQTLTLTSDGRLANDGGTIAGNGAIDLTAASMTNANGTVQSQHAITAKVTGTLDNTAGTIASGDALTLSAGRLTNRDTFDPNAQPDAAAKGLFGRTVALDAAMIDNTRGQIQSSQSLSVRGGELDNAGGAIGGSGTVTLTLASLDNTGGQLLQYAQDGALAITTTGALTNAAGQIGSLGTASLRSGSVDNRGGTAFGWHGLSVQTDGDLINRDGGFLSAGRSDDATTAAEEMSVAALDVRTGGVLDNSAGAMDATGHLTAAAGSLTNAAGQILAGSAGDAESALTVDVTNTLDNRGGTLASRGGDVQLTMRTLDNTAAGRVVAMRDLVLNANAVNNDAGTVFAERNLRYDNAAGTLDNGSGQFGAGETATVSLANVSNAANGRIQANTLWLTTPNLSTDGEIVGNTVHAQLANLSGTGRLYGAEELDAKFSGDYTYGSGPRLESDVKLGLNVAGTFTNRGTLQTPGELALSATNVINAGTINASNTDGSGHATITATGSITNQRGASLEGDLLELKAEAIDNTGDIVGDAVVINAGTLTNGQDLGTAQAVRNYGEGFIGAANYLALETNQLRNLDAEIYSGGDLDVSGRGGTGTRAAKVENLSGRIQAEGDATIAADEINNARRMLAVETYTLSADEAYALSSQKQFDALYAAMSPQDRTDYDRIAGLPKGAATAADKLRLAQLLPQLGWVRVPGLSPELYAVADAELNRIAITEYGARSSWMIENPSALVRQNDTYQTGQRLVDAQTSAQSEIVVGGDLTLDTGGMVRNYASRIAAGGNLTIAGAAFDPNSSDPRVENIVVAGQYTGRRATTAWIFAPPVKTQYTDGRGTHQTVAEFAATMTGDLVATGPSVADATITAGGGVRIEAGDVTNTAVTAGNGIGVIGGGDVGAGASTGTGSAASASTAVVDGPGAAHGGTVAGSTGPGAAQGGAVTNQTGPAGAASQTVGTPERPLPGLVPPDNGRFKTNTDPNSPYLVTTAPRFAKGDSTGSDYLIALLGVSSDVHKRLGDGYYEQQLVLDQILQLTGRRSLGGDPLDQYRSLMDGAAAEAARLGLPLGAPLTSDQIASLSQDIVWLVEQEVNGQKVLVPVVYLSKATAERLAADGALIDGDTLDVRSTGTIRNDGTLSGSNGTWLSADQLINDGAIKSSGGQVGITTQRDTVNRGVLAGHSVVIDAGGDVVNTVKFAGINATAGKIQAGAGGLSITAARDVINQGVIASDGVAMVKAGRDFVQDAATNASTGMTVKAPAGSITSTGSTLVQADRDVVLDQSAIKAGQHVVIDAGRDASFNASTVEAGGSLAVSAVRDIVSTAVVDTATAVDVVKTKEGKKKTTTTTRLTDETVRGSTFKANGDIAMVAEGGSVDLTATTVRSDNGAVVLQADQGDVNLRAGYETDKQTVDSQSKKKKTLSKTTTTDHTEVSDTTAVGTTISGKTVGIAAQNILVSGSNVVSDEGTTLAAKHNVTVENVYDTHEESHSSTKTKSGIFGNGGASVTAGKQRQTFDSKETSNYVVGSSVGSLNGDTTVIAGDALHVKASAISSPEGSVTLIGKSVNIEEAHNTTTYSEKTSFKQSGVTLAASAPVVDSALATRSAARSTGESKDDRVNAMAAANTAYGAYETGQAAAALASGNGNASVSLTLGSQKSGSQMNSTSSQAVGSTISAKGSTTVVAMGAGEASTIRVSGSDVYGGTSTTLVADGAIDIVAAQSTHEQHSSNSSSGWNVGVAATYGSGGGAAGITAGVNKGQGNSDGKSVSNVNSHIGSGGTTTVSSGGTLTIAGGQIGGNRVEVDAKNLVVESLQDTQTYDSKQQDASVQVTAGYGVSVSASYSQSKINSNYASVNEQSGILAGDGGYSVKVKEKTDLKGGLVTSSDAAEAAGKNSFSTGTLTVSDIDNHADYKGTSFGVSGSAGVNGQGERGQYQAAQGSSDGKAGGKSVSKAVGFGQDKDHQSSTTNSGINTSNLTITDAAGQAATGKSIDQIKAEVATTTSTDTAAANSGALVNKFNAADVERELATQLQVTQTFDRTQQGVRREINEYIDEARHRKDDAAAKLKENPNLSPEEKAALVATAIDAQKEIERLQKVGVLVNVIASGLASPADGAGGIATATLAPGVSYLIGQQFKRNEARNDVDNGDRPEEGSAAHLLAHALLGAAVGASGGGDGALLSALAAGGAEAVAPGLAKYLYGKEAKDLTAEEKETIGAIVGVGGAVLGSLGNDVSALINASSASQNAANNNWGEVGHYSTMATVLYLAGFSERDAKAIALAAWGPDTNSNNAITIENVIEGKDPKGHQQADHLLDGDADPKSVVARQEELGRKVEAVLTVLKRYENDPVAKAGILSDPRIQGILHAFGDSFAHVDESARHYSGGLGHLADWTAPDEPDRHPEAYANYTAALYKAAASASGSSVDAKVKLDVLASAVSSKATSDAQKMVLADAIKSAGGTDASGLVNSPVPGCEFLDYCGRLTPSNTTNPVIQQIYGVERTPSGRLEPTPIKSPVNQSIDSAVKSILGQSPVPLKPRVTPGAKAGGAR